MLFSEETFRLNGEPISAIVSGHQRSFISPQYVASHNLGPRFCHGTATEAISVQTVGGYFTCLLQLSSGDINDGNDISLGLDWLAFLREHFSEMGVSLSRVNSVSSLSHALSYLAFVYVF